MGIAAGRPIPDGHGSTFHVEAGDDGLSIWSEREEIKYLRLDKEATASFIDSLLLHAALMGWDLKEEIWLL